MNLTKDIEKLCREVSQEQDGDKLLALVDQLNKELEGIAKVPDESNMGQQTRESSPHPEMQRPEKNPNAA